MQRGEESPWKAVWDLLCRTSGGPVAAMQDCFAQKYQGYLQSDTLKCCVYEGWKRAGSGIKEGIEFPPMCAAACSAGANAQQDTVKRAGSEPFGVWWLISCHNWLIVWRCCCRSEPGRVKWDGYRGLLVVPNNSVHMCAGGHGWKEEQSQERGRRQAAGCLCAMAGRCGGLWSGLAGLHSSPGFATHFLLGRRNYAVLR